MGFRFLNTGAKCGSYHMATDRVLLRRIEAGISEPCLRVYQWEPFCLTLGYSQNAIKEFVKKDLAQRNWSWVKRPTGGRAVLHAEEFTYSLLAASTWAPWCATRDQSYAQIGKALQLMLHNLGIPTDLARGDSSGVVKSTGPSRPCFASTSRLEVTLAGKKLVGSAQRRMRNSFLQHGSLPLNDDFLQLVDVLPLSLSEREATRQEMQSHAISLAHFGKVSFQDLAAQAKNAFGQTLGIPFESKGLTLEESEEIEAEWKLNPHGLRDLELEKEAIL